MLEIYEERDKITSNSYTLHTLTDNGNHAKLMGMLQRGVEISPFDYAQINCDILGSMFKGNVTFKRSASGGRTTCYLHLFGDTLVKGMAKDYGYDTQSESMRLALVKLLKVAENLQNKSLVESLLSGFSDGKTWKNHFKSKGVFAAHIGG